MALVQTWCLETTIWNSEKSFYGPWSYKKRWIGFLWGKLNFKAYISELDLYLNESRIRQRYRMHNAYVMATVPKGNDTNWLLMDSDCFIWMKALKFETNSFHVIRKIGYLFIILKMVGNHYVIFLRKKFHQLQFLMTIDLMIKEAIRKHVDYSWIPNLFKIVMQLSRKVLIPSNLFLGIAEVPSSENDNE